MNLNPLSDFDSWKEKIGPELKEVELLLSLPLSDQPEVLIRQTTEIEAFNGRIGYLLAQAEAFLDTCSFLLLPGKEGLTEYERKISLDNAVSDQRKWRNRIESIADAIRTRIMLAQSLLKHHGMNMERSLTLKH